jgi:hypothetical protein
MARNFGKGYKTFEISYMIHTLLFIKLCHLLVGNITNSRMADTELKAISIPSNGPYCFMQGLRCTTIDFL